MPELQIRIKKKNDGSGALTCERADGTTTWQRQTERTANFYAHHDLTHYAVESTLNCRNAFFGLVSQGWEFADFGEPWSKGPLPDAALRVELIVGFLDVERASMARWTAAEFNHNATVHNESRGSSLGTAVGDEELESMRKLRQELFERWDAVPTGETLELSFSVD